MLEAKHQLMECHWLKVTTKFSCTWLLVFRSMFLVSLFVFQYFWKANSHPLLNDGAILRTCWSRLCHNSVHLWFLLFLYNPFNCGHRDVRAGPFFCEVGYYLKAGAGQDRAKGKFVGRGKKCGTACFTLGWGEANQLYLMVIIRHLKKERMK